MPLPTSLRGLMAERPVLGTFLKIPRFEIVDVLALSGFDFVVCDYEHSQMSVGEACDVVRAGRARGLPVLVRVPALDHGDINRVLEAGAAGIQLARGAGHAAPTAAVLPTSVAATRHSLVVDYVPTVNRLGHHAVLSRTCHSI